MKYEPHTPEWLRAARAQAGLTMAKLANLAGVHTNTVQYAETKHYATTPEVWAKFDAALYPLVPLFFINENALIANVQAYMHLRGEEAACRLYYVLAPGGVAFSDVRAIEEEELPGRHVVVTWQAALSLLEAQGELLG